jgi:hypothetical protein
MRAARTGGTSDNLHYLQRPAFPHRPARWFFLVQKRDSETCSPTRNDGARCPRAAILHLLGPHKRRTSFHRWRTARTRMRHRHGPLPEPAVETPDVPNALSHLQFLTLRSLSVRGTDIVERGQPFPESVQRGLGPVREVQFGKDVANVGPDRGVTDEEGLSDLLV